VNQDFFGKPAFLTVSGQLNAETYATALSDVHTSSSLSYFLAVVLTSLKSSILKSMTEMYIEYGTYTGVYLWSHIPSRKFQHF